MKRNIQVCFCIDLFHKYSNKGSIVVVVDLLRATSVISTAFEFGVKEIIPVTTLEEAISYQHKDNHIVAAERNTEKIEGFDFGNSPYHYMNTDIKGKTLVLTTTNGTKAIHAAKQNIVITASFINIDAVTNYIESSNYNVTILCSGWKGLFNLEDTIFAGALAKKILNTNRFTSNCDSLQASVQLYNNASSNNLFEYLARSSYRKRNNSKQVIRDTHFCLNPTVKSNIVPIFNDTRLVKAF